MGTILPAMLYLALLFLPGIALARLLCRGEQRLPAEWWLPLSFALGLGVHAVACSLCLLILGAIPWIGIYLFHATVAVAGLWYSSARPGFPTLDGFTPLPADANRNLLRLLALVGIVFFATLYHNAITFPFTGYDGQAIWSFKAAILAHEGTVYTPTFVDPARVHYHRNYPILVPMVLAGLYRAQGAVNEPGARVILTTFFPMLVVAFFAVARRLGAAPLVAALAAVPLFSLPWRNDFGERDGGVLGSGSIDLQFGFFAFLSVACFMIYWREGRRWQWWIGAICGGLCVMTKSEGLLVVAATAFANFAQAILAPGQYTRRAVLLRAVAAPVAAIAVALPWLLVQSRLPNFYDEDYGGQLNAATIAAGIERLPVILQVTGADAARVWKWNYIWVVFAALMPFAAAGWLRRKDFFLDACLLPWMAACIFVYTISPLNLAFHLSTSSARLMSQMAPLVVLRILAFFLERLTPR